MECVSVVIPAFNSEQWIGATLKSVIEQTYPKLEIIVVDDGSIDRTAEIAREILKAFKGPCQVLSQPNQGVSAARNRGWRAASGAWVQFLDSDDLLAREKVSVQMEIAEDSSTAVAIIYSSWQHVAGEEELRPVRPVQRPQVDDKPPACLLISKNCITTGSYLVRRDTLLRTGGFDERMHIYEDLELLVRIAEGGGKFRFAPSLQPLLLYRIFPDQTRWGDESARYRMTEVSQGWLDLVRRTARKIEHFDLSLDDRDDLMVDCTMWLRLLYRYDRAAGLNYLKAARNLIPGFTPVEPYWLHMISKYLGYVTAERVATMARFFKKQQAAKLGY